LIPALTSSVTASLLPSGLDSAEFGSAGDGLASSSGFLDFSLVASTAASLAPATAGASLAPSFPSAAATIASSAPPAGALRAAAPSPGIPNSSPSSPFV